MPRARHWLATALIVALPIASVAVIIASAVMLVAASPEPSTRFVTAEPAAPTVQAAARRGGNTGHDATPSPEVLAVRTAAIASSVQGDAPVAARASGQPPARPDLDALVTKFLQDRRYTWRDMNVPEADGRALHDLIVKHGYTRALEIGTSTGHSGVWIGWALSKTGGKLVTVDIDESRHREAVANFKETGVAPFIDARLADAHDLVPKLEGPFDFVFIDADKEWYVNYAKAVVAKVPVGGCIAAHNVSASRGRRWGMGADYYAYITSLPEFETTVVNGQLAISYKRR